MDPNDCVHHVSQAHYSILNMFSPGRASVPSVIAPATRRQTLADSGPLEVRGKPTLQSRGQPSKRCQRGPVKWNPKSY